MKPLVSAALSLLVHFLLAIQAVESPANSSQIVKCRKGWRLERFIRRQTLFGRRPCSASPAEPDFVRPQTIFGQDCSAKPVWTSVFGHGLRLARLICASWVRLGHCHQMADGYWNPLYVSLLEEAGPRLSIIFFVS